MDSHIIDLDDQSPSYSEIPSEASLDDPELRVEILKKKALEPRPLTQREKQVMGV